MARLNGWQRIGIIVSVVWILGAGIFTYNAEEKYQWEIFKAQSDLLAAEAWHKYLSEHSHDMFAPDVIACERCVLLKEQFLTSHRRVALGVSALVAFTTVALAWGLAYLILFLVNWVKRGFINAGNSN